MNLCQEPLAKHEAGQPAHAYISMVHSVTGSVFDGQAVHDGRKANLAPVLVMFTA